MKKTLLLFAVLLGFISLNAQDNPFAELGYEPKIATLSNGQFNESFDNDTIVQIGSVLFNTKSKQIVAFVVTDTMYSEATLEPDIVSRWISPDPLAEQFPNWSPYAYVYNNPISFIDPDGRKGVGYIDNNGKLHIQATYYAVTEGKTTYSNTELNHIQGTLNNFWAGAAGKTVSINGAEYEIAAVNFSVVAGGDLNNVWSKVTSEDDANMLNKASADWIKGLSSDNTKAVSMNLFGEDALNSTFYSEQEAMGMLVGDELKEYNRIIADESAHMLGTEHPLGFKKWKEETGGTSRKSYNQYREGFGDVERMNYTNGKANISQKDLQNIVESNEFKLIENK